MKKKIMMMGMSIVESLNIACVEVEVESIPLLSEPFHHLGGCPGQKNLACRDSKVSCSCLASLVLMSEKYLDDSV